MLSIGLMSGTSLDGVDAVILDTAIQPQVVASASVALGEPLTRQLQTLACPGHPIGTPAESKPHATEPADLIDLLGMARRNLARCYASAVHKLPGALRDQCTVIGAHGQTIRHRPEDGYTLQILDGALLADATGLPVVCDLRSADVAAGGQGAPLVPAFHAAVFGGTGSSHPASPLAVVNIGGIANVSIVTGNGEVLAGFDTGPGNRLMDDWIRLNQDKAFDPGGTWAASGQVLDDLLTALLRDPYYAAPAPKSTGREQFNLQYLQQQLQQWRHSDAPAADIQATLGELTARTVALAVMQWPVDKVLVCGGGALNTDLMGRLRRQLALLAGKPILCEATDSAGIPAQAMEAAAFAWLAQRRWREKPVALSAATGARYPVIAGAIHLPAPGSG